MYDPEMLKILKEIREEAAMPKKPERLPLNEMETNSALQSFLREITNNKLYVIFMESQGDTAYYCTSISGMKNGEKRTFKFLVVSPSPEPLKMEIYNRCQSINTLIGFGDYEQILKIGKNMNAIGIFYVFDPNSLTGIFITTEQMNLYINNGYVSPLIDVNKLRYKLSDFVNGYQKQLALVETFPISEIMPNIRLRIALKDIVNRAVVYFGIKNGTPFGFVKEINGRRNLFVVISNSDDVFKRMSDDNLMEIVPIDINDLLSCIDSDCEIYYMLQLSGDSVINTFISKDQIKQYLNDNSHFPKIIDMNNIVL